jgi:alpha-tubulin suppressor-like RCC1 family protein
VAALRSTRAALFCAAVFAFAACGSGITNPVDPVGGVAAAFDIAKAGGALKAMDLVGCLTTGGAVSSAFSGLFGGLTGAQLATYGITADDVNAAFKISFDNLQTSEVSRSGDTATVHVNVKVTTAIDPGKLKELIKKYGASQGVVPDDATIDAQIQRLGGQLTQSETITKDIRVVQQDGKWVACGAEFSAAGATAVTGSSAATPTLGLATASPVVTPAPGQTATPVVTVAPGATPTPVASGGTTIPNISGSAVALVAGNGFACALISDGNVKCWGKNDKGQLGTGTTTDSATPVSPLGLGTGVKSISAPTLSAYACAVTAAGGVKCWGTDSAASGTLGNGTLASSTVPVDVAGLTSGASSVATGYQDACAVIGSGGLKCWGKNGSGQLGNGTNVDSGVPVDVSGLSGVIAVAPAQNYACALTAAGGVKCWGDNSFSQLGNGSTSSSMVPVDVVGLASGVTAITVGSYGNCALTTAGGVKCWGGNNTIPMDVVGLTSGVLSITGIGGIATCASTADARLVCWGSDPTPKDSTAQFGGTFAALVFGGNGSGSGANITCVLTHSGGVACATQGSTTWVEITGLIPGSAPVVTPSTTTGDVGYVAVGFQHSCVVTTAGGAKCWGSTPGNGTVNSPTPVDVLGLTIGVSAIAAGESVTCALTNTGGVKCWGQNTYGQLGNGSGGDSTIPVDVTGLTSGVIAIATGEAQACALTTAGGVKCWGLNISPTPVDVAGLESGVLSISVGNPAICALTSSGGVKCWSYTQPPADVTGLTSGVKAIDAGSSCAVLSTGGAQCWMGTADVSSLTGLQAISGTCVITATGGVKCWGTRLGNGTAVSSTTPVDVVGLSSGVRALSSGNDGVCAVTVDYLLECWGGSGSLPANTIPTLIPGL